MDFLGHKTTATSVSAPVTGAGYGREGNRARAHILVVDDVPANVELLEALLMSDGFDRNDRL